MKTAPDAYAAVRSVFRDTLFNRLGVTPNDRILLAFSGGADSSLLLRFLLDESFSVTAAHVHHGIRGEEADRDEAFCRSVCRELNVPFLSFHVDVPFLAAQSGKGIEETAREARYACLNAALDEQGIPYLLTAHHADDNLETVLFRLMRGTGLPGLCGIPLCRGRILRPLLFCEKKDILRACREKNIPFVTDSTNNDLSAARNYLRQEIVPRLKSKNPSIVSHVSDMTRRLNRDEAFLKAEAGRYSLSDGRRALSALPDALLTRLLIREMVSAGITPDDEHVENAVGILRSDSVRTHLSCPGGLMTVDRDTVRFSAWQESPPPISERPIGPGLTELDGGSALYLGTPFGDASKDINMLKNIYKFAIQESVDSAKIETVSLRVRGRLPGDVYRLGGMTRQVKKLLQSKKTALRDRTSLPFLLAGDEILWIPGFPVSDGFRPDGRETTVPLVFFFEKNETTDKSERVSHAET